MKIQLNLFLTCSLTFLIFFNNPLIAAEIVPNSSTIIIGKTGSESGNDSLVGKNMTLGIKIYFDKVNASGGILGRKLQLIALDDGYDPIRAGKNVRDLIEKDNVLALIGNNGSPGTVVVIPILNEEKTLLFAPFTGAEFIYNHQPYVIPLRPSYNSEVRKTIKELLAAGIKPNEIAFFTQNDPFGDSVHNGGMAALKEAGYANAELLAHGKYTRETLNVESALVSIFEQAKTPPKVFIMGGVSPANTKFVKLAQQQFPQAIYIAVSGFFAAKDFGAEEKGKIFATQVVPSYEANLPTCKEYLADLKHYGAGAEPGFTSLQGYVAAKVLVLGLKQAISEKKLTRQGIIEVLDNMHDVDIGIGINVNFDKSHKPGLTNVWMTILKEGKFVSVDWSELKSYIK
jgi:branched-chain amino acid transport system substrate-binding protein